MCGLALSITKTSFFSSGFTQQEIQQLEGDTRLIHAFLPIIYLGVPLCTKKLTLLNCEPLLQKIKSKISSWSARSLSFAGRLHLLNSVIDGITKFWCSSLFLPKKCIKLIKSICSVFLCKGSTEGRHTTRVAWEKFTLRKEEGGLGLRDLISWNKACLLKLIWLLFFRSGSVWVTWYKKMILSDNLSNLWTEKPKQTNSWQANKLLKVRHILYPWIKLMVEDGKSCYFWTDNWSPYRSLNSYLNPQRPTRLGIRPKTTLTSLWRNNSWKLLVAISNPQVNLHVHLTTLNLSDRSDYYE